MGFISNIRDRFIQHDKSVFGRTINYNDLTPTYEGQNYTIQSYADVSIMISIYNRIAMDCSSINIKHVIKKGASKEDMDVQSGLNECMSFNANIDQSGREIVYDAVMMMLNEGHAVIVPTYFDDDGPSMVTEVRSLRVGSVMEWYTDSVKVELYDEETGKLEQVTVPKNKCAVCHSPFKNLAKHNVIMKRLIAKMRQLDKYDDMAVSDKLNLLIQLPYTIRGEEKQRLAKDRLKQLENQLKSNKMGIAYIDGAEKVIQLGQPIQNDLLKEVDTLNAQLLSLYNLDITVLNGTANEQVMLNYYERTTEPLLQVITDAMTNKFLTKTARSQGHRVVYFRDPFRVVPAQQLSAITETFSRNAILTPNEIREILGYAPDPDPESDKLINRNIAGVNQGTEEPTTEGFFSQLISQGG